MTPVLRKKNRNLKEKRPGLDITWILNLEGNPILTCSSSRILTKNCSSCTCCNSSNSQSIPSSSISPWLRLPLPLKPLSSQPKYFPLFKFLVLPKEIERRRLLTLNGNTIRRLYDVALDTAASLHRRYGSYACL